MNRTDLRTLTEEYDKIRPRVMTKPERNVISKEFTRVGLGGMGHFESLSKAIQAVNHALESAGTDFFLAMVTGDLLLGHEGSRQLDIEYNTGNGDESKRLEKNRVSFSWYNRKSHLEDELPDYEVVCYIS